MNHNCHVNNNYVVYFCSKFVDAVPIYDDRDKFAKMVLKRGFECPFCKSVIKINENGSIENKDGPGFVYDNPWFWIDE